MERLVPFSWQILPDGWNVFVHYATLNMPIEPNGFYHYIALQQLSYFGVVFLFAPVSMLSGMAMSPVIENRFHWIPKIFGNWQGARSVHFLVMLGYVGFVIIHVSMVILTGLVRNMNHITQGTGNPNNIGGLNIGIGILLISIAFAFVAHWISWKRLRVVQRLEAVINGNLGCNLSITSAQKFIIKKKYIALFLAKWKSTRLRKMAHFSRRNFKDYKLKVGELVENPVELSRQN